MKGFFAWFGRSILLPLLPAIVGTVMRSVFSGHWELASVDGTELAFCVALIGVFTHTGVTRQPDRALRDALSPLFVLLLAVALCLFAGSLLMTTYHQGEQVDLIAQFKQTQPPNLSLLATVGQDDRCTTVLSYLRT